MTFSLRTSAPEFAAAVSACAPFIDRAGTIPVLKTIRISVADGVATLMATNIEQVMTVRIAAEGTGTVCIDAGSLDAKVKTLGKGGFEASESERFINIAQGRTRWKLPFLLDDFQVAPEVAGKQVQAGADFIAALKTCRPAADIGGRFYLDGVHTDGNRVVATDGHEFRLIEIEASLPVMTIPSKVVGNIVSLFPDGCYIRASSVAAVFSHGDISLRTKLVEGEFPAYRRLIDGVVADVAGTILTDAKEFAGAIVRAIAITADSEKAGSFVATKLHASEDTILITTRNQVGEEGSDSAPCEASAPLEISVNGRMLLSAVQSLDCDTIEVCFKDHASPLLMRPKAGGREDLRIVMPRRF